VNVLLDSHCVLWWLADLPLTEEARAAITDPASEVFVSAASIWELEIKSALGRLTIDGDLSAEVEAAGFAWLPITQRHARAAAHLPPHHRDPFDRMLIAQAQLEGHTIVTRDRSFERSAVELIRA